MKRSEINARLSEAMDFFHAFQFQLPPWSSYTLKEWREEKNLREIIDCGLGWDITGFGIGDFSRCGLTLFTLRNGAPGYEKTYAEKIMMVRSGQVTPCHFHWSKQEDIINRGGGNLIIELHHADPLSNKLTGNDFTITVDGIPRRMASGGRLVLTPGESVTMRSCHAHSFWGDGEVLVGEVSKVNDDKSDNCFIGGATPRFEPTEEDVEPRLIPAADYLKFGLSPR